MCQWGVWPFHCEEIWHVCGHHSEVGLGDISPLLHQRDAFFTSDIPPRTEDNIKSRNIDNKVEVLRL